MPAVKNTSQLDIFKAVPVTADDAGGGWQPMDSAPHDTWVQILTAEGALFERTTFSAGVWVFPVKTLLGKQEVLYAIHEPLFWRPRT